MTKHQILSKDVRKVIPVGGSLAITLPADYVKAHNIKPGDKIELTYNEVFLGEPIRMKLLKEKEKLTKAKENHEEDSSNE